MVLKTKKLQDLVTTKERGLRPYVALEDVTYRQALDRTTWAEMQNLAPEAMSEFEKPYILDGYNYPEMQYTYPWPIVYRWPQIRWPDFPGSQPGNWDFSTPRQPAGACTIECASPFRCQDPVECFVSDSAIDWSASYTGGVNSGDKISADRGEFGEHSTLPGRGLSIDPPSGDVWNSWGSDNGQDKLSICIQTDTGECCDTLDMFCFYDECGEADPLAADTASNPDTMTQSDSISIAVTGGVGPFNWESLGTYTSDETQYTFGAAQTAGRTNSLDSSATACGSAHVRVTDSCGNTANIYVRNTSSGSWVADHVTNCSISCSCSCGGCYGGGGCTDSPDTIYEGEEAVRLHQCFIGVQCCTTGCCSCSCSGVDCACSCSIGSPCTPAETPMAYTTQCGWQKWSC